MPSQEKLKDDMSPLFFPEISLPQRNAEFVSPPIPRIGSSQKFAAVAYSLYFLGNESCILEAAVSDPINSMGLKVHPVSHDYS